MKFWTDFAEKHPAAAKWIREGRAQIIEALQSQPPAARF